MWTADAAIASVGRSVINFEADGSVLYTGQGLGTQACDGFDGLGFAGDWLFGDCFGWHGKKDICPNRG